MKNGKQRKLNKCQMMLMMWKWLYNYKQQIHKINGNKQNNNEEWKTEEIEQMPNDVVNDVEMVVQLQVTDCQDKNNKLEKTKSHDDKVYGYLDQESDDENVDRE
eukprot:403500_1